MMTHSGPESKIHTAQYNYTSVYYKMHFFLQPHPHPPLLNIQTVHCMNIYDEGEGGLCFSNCWEFH